jgi:hypothetical protein
MNIEEKIDKILYKMDKRHKGEARKSESYIKINNNSLTSEDPIDWEFCDQYKVNE